MLRILRMCKSVMRGPVLRSTCHAQNTGSYSKHLKKPLSRLKALNSSYAQPIQGQDDVHSTQQGHLAQGKRLREELQTGQMTRFQG